MLAACISFVLLESGGQWAFGARKRASSGLAPGPRPARRLGQARRAFWELRKRRQSLTCVCAAAAAAMRAPAPLWGDPCVEGSAVLVTRCPHTGQKGHFVQPHTTAPRVTCPCVILQVSVATVSRKTSELSLRTKDTLEPGGLAARAWTNRPQTSGWVTATPCPACASRSVHPGPRQGRVPATQMRSDAVTVA